MINQKITMLCIEKIFLNSVGVICLLLLGDVPLARINLRRQWLSYEITKSESNIEWIDDKYFLNF